MMTLLVKSKPHGKAAVYPTFEGQRNQFYSPMKPTLMTLKSDRRDLTNRVNDDAVCADHDHFVNLSIL